MPAPGTTAQILDALAKECVEATFFTIGRNVEEFPDLAKREAAEGHTVAHHTYSHPQPTMRQMSVTDARADVVRGMLMASVGATLAADLELAPLALADAPTPGRLSFGSLEPLAGLLQETPA